MASQQEQNGTNERRHRLVGYAQFSLPAAIALFAQARQAQGGQPAAEGHNVQEGQPVANAWQAIGPQGGRLEVQVMEVRGARAARQRTANRNKIYRCDRCESTFPAEILLKTHRRVSHSPFTCEQCGNVYRRKSSLKKHKLIHSASKHYTCDVCEDTFTDLLKLSRHRTHHRNVPFTCEKCYVGFDSPSSLREHMLIHKGQKPFVCHLCGLSFIMRSTLNNHLLTHGRWRHYKCNWCEEEFSEMKELMPHLRTHVGR